MRILAINGLTFTAETYFGPCQISMIQAFEKMLTTFNI